MHIGIDARLPFHRRGGISEYVSELIETLAGLESPHRFTIFHSRRDPLTRFPRRAANMARADLDTPCHHRYERLLLGAELAPYGLEIFHSPDFIPPVQGATRRVVTVHDLCFLSRPSDLPAESFRHYAGQIEWALRQADLVIAVSEHTRGEILARFHVPTEKVAVTPLSASGRFRADHDAAAVSATLERLGLDSGFILFVGTVEPRKNLATLIRAHEGLRSDLHDAPPLVVAGPPGWLSDGLPLGDAGPVRWLREVQPDDLAHLYASACLLALPSFGEGFGLPVLEAMQSGCPVVVSNAGALPETAGDAAIFVDPTDPAAWQTALASVLRDRRLRCELREKGLARAARFSWDTTARRTLRLYEAASSEG